MPSPTVAQKAARTRKRRDALVRGGMPSAQALAQARRENNAGLLDSQGRLKTTPGVPPTAPAQSGSTSGSSTRRPSAPATTQASPPPTPAGVAGVASRFQRAAEVPQEDEDATTKALRNTALLVKPTWEVKGNKLRLWSPKSSEVIELEIEKQPGPYTPTEVIHDIMGQPEMLYTIALGFLKQMGSLIEGPTGTAKTMAYRWLAQKLNWNIVTSPMHKDIEAADLIGEPQPSISKKDELLLKWVWGSLSKAALASQEKPTIFVFEELNRAGNLQVFARLYPLLDDTRALVIDNKEGEEGVSEVLRPGKLLFGATQNPADAEEDLAGHADYIGVQELDPALRRRFPFQRIIGYPPEEIEAEALRRRVKGLALNDAKRMVKAATAARVNEEIRYPMSFPDLHAWAEALPFYGWEEAAEISVVVKAHPDYRSSIRDLVRLKPTA